MESPLVKKFSTFMKHQIFINTFITVNH